MRWKGFLAVTGIIMVITLAWIGLIGAMGYFELDRVEITRTFVLDPGSNLTVENYDGKTEIDLWDGDSVELKFIKKTRFGKEELDRVDLEIENEGDLFIGLERERYVDWVETDFEIRVPSFVNISRVKNQLGTMVIDGVSGNITVVSESGAVSIQNVESIRKVSSSSGGIEIKNCGYVNTVTADNGGIMIENCDHVRYARVNNGGIMVKGTGILEEASAENGGIDVEVGDILTGGMLFSAENGGIMIKIPESLGADFDMRVQNGEVQLKDFGDRTYDIDDETEKIGSVNGGGPLIKARAENGGIIIEGA
jgi:hypothetical protein